MNIQKLKENQWNINASLISSMQTLKIIDDYNTRIFETLMYH